MLKSKSLQASFYGSYLYDQFLKVFPHKPQINYFADCVLLKMIACRKGIGHKKGDCGFMSTASGKVPTQDRILCRIGQYRLSFYSGICPRYRLKG